MATTVAKIKDLQYNELAVMGVIEKDADLLEIFQEDIRMPFNILYSLQKEDKLNDKTKELLVDIFDGIILTKTDLIDKYLRLVDAQGATVEEIVAEPIVEEVKPKATPKPKAEVKQEVKKEVKPKAEVEIPRRYGKVQVLEDIKKQGGKPTPVQRLALAMNDLKNVNANLTSKTVKQMIGGQQHFTDEQCRQLEQLVITVLRQTNEVLNPKRKNGK